MSLDVDKLDFDHCEEEPIHIPESVQSFGYLFALNEAGEVEVLSENTHEIFGEINIYRSNFFNLIEESQVSFLRATIQRVKELTTKLPVEIHFKEGRKARFSGVVYQSGKLSVIEIEFVGSIEHEYCAKHFIKMYELNILMKSSKALTVKDISQEIANTIKFTTNYDRVFVYKFLSDGSGVVISESKEPGIESFLGIHYPKEDIPEQARELYRKNWIRMDPDVDKPISRLLPLLKDSKRSPLDLTHSYIRSLSPIHRQYITNLGVKASLSISLLVKGRLWGVVVCHNKTPRYISQNVRIQCENLSQLFSWHLRMNEEALRKEKRAKANEAINYVLERILKNKNIVETFKEYEEHVLKLMDADGFMYHSDSETLCLGTCPKAPEVKKFIFSMAGNFPDDPVDTNEASLEDEEGQSRVSGMLYIPLVKGREYFISWFRKEQKIIQTWVGHMQEERPPQSKRERLTPRKDFVVHERILHGSCRKWNKLDLEMADYFQRIFLAYFVEKQRGMRKQVERLVKLDHSKNQFLAQLAHELKNPLSPIASGVELLQMESDHQAREKIHKSISRQLQQMQRMIDDLLDIARIARGKIPLINEKLCMNEVLMESEETVRGLVREKGHELIMNLPSSDIYFCGDRVRLTQVFSNLLHNAAKYTNPGGRIEVELRKLNSEIIVKVQDNGLGIPEGQLESVFSIFNQVDPDAIQGRGGLGIGLSLVRGIVEVYGGKVMARSEGEGLGSEFEVVLPALDKQKLN